MQEIKESQLKLNGRAKLNENVYTRIQHSSPTGSMGEFLVEIFVSSRTRTRHSRDDVLATSTFIPVKSTVKIRCFAFFYGRFPCTSLRLVSPVWTWRACGEGLYFFARRAGMQPSHMTRHVLLFFEFELESEFTLGTGDFLAN